MDDATVIGGRITNTDPRDKATQYSGCYRLGVWPNSNLATDDRSLQFQPSRIGRLGSPTEETDACFIVRDANGQALAYVVYFEEEPGRRSAARDSPPTGQGASPSCRGC